MTQSDIRPIVAVDLGGTRFRVALFDTVDGPPSRVVRHPSEADQGPEHVIDLIVSAIADIQRTSGQPIFRIGVAAPGPLDPWKGLVFAPPNMPGWDDETPLASILEQRTGIRTVLGNDANLAAVGEHRSGAGKGVKNLVYLTISTGIGGGVIADDKLLLGEHGLAGELGHVTIDPMGPPCNCGGRGHLEAFASGTAIAEVARARLARGDESSITTGDATTTKDIADAARNGDPLAIQIFANAASHLGVGIANFVYCFDPALVILGGAVTNAGDLLFDPIRSWVDELVMPRFRGVPIVRAALGDDAGLYGAAAIARDQGALR